MSGVMTQRRAIKQRSQKVWDAARAAYLEGEPAASVARRFDVGYGNLRYRAQAEGWTRKAQMAAEAEREAEEDALLAAIASPADDPGPSDGPGPSGGAGPGPDEAAPGALSRIDPPTVRRRALARADALLAAGRAAEALVQLKAAEALVRLGAVESEAAAMQAHEDDTEAVRLQIGQIVEVRATELAHVMLAEGVRPGVRWGGYALRWRAATYGTEAAESDRRMAQEEGWADAYWDAQGRLKPGVAGEMG